MLNPFPELLAFALMAPFIIRIFAGSYFVLLGLRLFQSKTDENVSPKSIMKYGTGAVAFLGGLFLFFGFLTQISAIVLTLLSLWNFYVSQNRTQRALFLMLAAMTSSLLFSGAGLFALDLPL